MGVVALFADLGRHPIGGWLVSVRLTQGSSFLATSGLCCGIPSGFVQFLVRDAGNDQIQMEKGNGTALKSQLLFPAHVLAARIGRYRSQI